MGIRGQGVKICVVGSGLDVNHSEFNRSAFSGYSGPSDLPWDEDPSGHGTQVTGVMAASDLDNVGISGIAPDAEYYIVRVFDENNLFTFSSNLIGAVDVCYAAGARIINLSLAGSEESQAERVAFARLADLGVLMVAAAGNFGPNSPPVYPASYEGVLSVSAINDAEQFWPFSSANEFVDLAAPGDRILTTSPNDKYDWISGTSLTAPFVSGVAALLWSFKPEANVSEIKSALIGGALDLGSEGRDDFYGHGLVQAMNSLEILNITYFETPFPSVSPSQPPSSEP